MGSSYYLKLHLKELSNEAVSSTSWYNVTIDFLYTWRTYRTKEAPIGDKQFRYSANAKGNIYAVSGRPRK